MPQRNRIVPTGPGCGVPPEPTTFALEMLRIDGDFFGGAGECLDCLHGDHEDGHRENDDEPAEELRAHGGR